MTPELRQRLTSEAIAILILLGAIALVLWRLPKVEVGHSEAFKRRRLWNWFPLGFTYALLYFGRYNLSANASTLEHLHLLSKPEYGTADFIGSITYGVAFLLNGPLTDRWGGRVTILLAAGGSAVMNLAMAAAFSKVQDGSMSHDGFVQSITVLTAANMYFQSFGAVSIVKVNAPWFHVRERGILGGVFGILISLGLYFAYDWSRILAKIAGMTGAFLVPSIVLFVMVVVDYFVIRDTPSDAGFPDFDTADASSGEKGHPTLREVVRKMASQKVIWLIVGIEFCSGFLRNGAMKWYIQFANDTGTGDAFVTEHWGALLCVAGILGGVFAGLISDYVFDSRRGPVASVLYGGLLASTIVAIVVLGSRWTGWVFVFSSLCVIGVHGMLSGTASADFGGKKHAGIATGIIDGFVYLGTGAQALLYGAILPQEAAAKKDIANWRSWPLAMLPLAVVGLVLATRVWNAKPKAAGAAPAQPPRDQVRVVAVGAITGPPGATGEAAAAGEEDDLALAATVATSETAEKK